MKILLFGPVTPPLNGQSVAFTKVVEGLKTNRKIIINTAKYNSSILNTVYAIIKTLDCFLKYKIELIYFTSSRSFFGFLKEIPLLLLARNGNTKVVNHLHGADFKKFYRELNFSKSLVRACYKGVHTSIILTDSMRNEFVDFPDIKLETVYNFYSKDLDEIEFSKKEDFQILYLSNLMFSKGIFYFLDACNMLLKKYSNLTVKIAGSPVSDKEMSASQMNSIFIKKINQLKQSFGDRINYEGTISGIEKVKLLFESSIFVLPTFYPTEAIPLSILEAMRSGNVIITTNHNYLPDLIDSNNGKLIEPKSSEGIIRAIEEYLANPETLKFIQEYNISIAKKKYSEVEFISKIQKILGV